MTFNFSSDNELGCTDCGCLPGASLGPACEHDPAGQCDCMDNVGGRTCDTPHPGYFIPKMDYIQAQSSADLMVCTYTNFICLRIF